MKKKVGQEEVKKLAISKITIEKKGKKSKTKTLQVTDVITHLLSLILLSTTMTLFSLPIQCLTPIPIYKKI